MKLHQITIPARDVEESARFYETLGWRRIVDASPRYLRFENEAGETLSLHHEEDWPEDGGRGPQVLVYFEYDDLDAEAARLKTLGVTFASEPETKSYLWREADLIDPAGHRIRLFQAGGDRRFPPWRIGDGA